MEVALITRKISNVMGGMERQITNIADGLIKNGHSVTIISLDTGAPDFFYDHNSRIKTIFLGIGDPTLRVDWTTRARRQIRVYRILKQEEITTIICFMTGAFWFSALPAKIARIKVILAERNGPSIYWRTRARRYRWIIFASMVFSNVITVQFPRYVKSYPRMLRRKIQVIPNVVPIFPNTFRADDDTIRFTFAGRFSNQKQVCELVKAFIRFSQGSDLYNLSLYGEGEKLDEVKRIIAESNSSSNINLHKSSKDIESILINSDVLIYPSIWEGFPNVVAEALAAGVPVAGFADCEGVRDLVNDGVNGWLVSRGTNSEKSIIKLLEKVILDMNKFEDFRSESRRSVEKYQTESIYKIWSGLIT